MAYAISPASLDHYRVFYLAAKYRSITKAAAELGVSQPAATKTLHSLEAKLKINLLLRNARGVALTPEGEIFYRELIPAFEHIQSAEEKLREAMALESGAVRICVDGLMTQYLLREAVSRFKSEYPGIFTFISKSNPLNIMDILSREVVELGILCVACDSSPVSSEIRAAVASGGFNKYPLGIYTDDFIVGPRFRNLSENTVDIGEVAALPLILPSREVQPSDYYAKLLRRDGVLLRTDLPVSGSASRLALARYNHGVTYFPGSGIRDELANGELFVVKTNAKMRRYELFILTNSRREPGAAPQKFISTVLKTMSEQTA